MNSKLAKLVEVVLDILAYLILPLCFIICFVFFMLCSINFFAPDFFEMFHHELFCIGILFGLSVFIAGFGEEFIKIAASWKEEKGDKDEKPQKRFEN